MQVHSSHSSELFFFNHMTQEFVDLKKLKVAQIQLNIVNLSFTFFGKLKKGISNI